MAPTGTTPSVETSKKHSKVVSQNQKKKQDGKDL